jgi:hypothetical protein
MRLSEALNDFAISSPISGRIAKFGVYSVIRDLSKIYYVYRNRQLSRNSGFMRNLGADSGSILNLRIIRKVGRHGEAKSPLKLSFVLDSVAVINRGQVVNNCE